MKLLRTILLLALGYLLSGLGHAATPLASVTRTNGTFFSAGSNVVIVGSGAYTWAMPIDQFREGVHPDQSLNLDLEQWPRMLTRGSNATMLAFGDSTGLYTMDYLREPVMHYLGSNGLFGGHFTPLELTGAYTNLSAASSTNWPGLHYVLGTNSSDGPGSMATTNYGANAYSWADTFRAYVQRSSSGGALIWQTMTNGGSWTTRAVIDSSGSYGIIATQLVVSPLGWYRSRLVYSNGGPSVVYGLEQFDGTATGRGARFFDLTYAGSAIGQLTNIGTNVLGPALRLLNPSVVFMEHRDSSNEYVNALPAVRSLFTNWIPDADIVLVGVGPSDDAGYADYNLRGQNAVAREFARTHRWGYLDMRAIRHYDSYFNLTNFYGASDGGGIHYPPNAKLKQAGFALSRMPILNNEFIQGLYLGGAPSMSPPEGRRYMDPRGSTNNFTGNLGVGGQAYVGGVLDVGGYVLTSGSSAGYVLANRSSPSDAGSRWTLYNSGGSLIHYYGGDIFEQNIGAGSYRFSPTTSGAQYSKLGDQTHAWQHMWSSSLTTTNSTNYGSTYISSVPIRAGTGSPESAVSGPVGSIYLRTDGSGAGGVMYLKTNGTGNTGWWGMQ